MSDLRVDDVAGSAGGTATNLMGGLAKVVVAIDSAGAQMQSGSGSLNVSSTTDNGVGNQKCTQTNPMATAYGGNVQVTHADTVGYPWGTVAYSAITVGVFYTLSMYMGVGGSSYTYVDPNYTNGLRLGDLA